jgi:endonuclease-3
MKKINEMILEFSKSYDGKKGSLNFNTPFELLIAVMLSAQCTDARVNIVTKDLFKKCNTPDCFAKMKLLDIEKKIKSISFFRNKAKHIKESSIKIIKEYDGQVPNSIEKLMTLSGIGRKSANVIMLEAFNRCEGIAVDTHALRISNRLGLSENSDATKVEKDLLKKIPKKYWPLMNHIFVQHGRAICTAKRPKCDISMVKKYCKYVKQIAK